MKKEKFILWIVLLACIDQVFKVLIILFKDKLPLILINNVLEIVYCENRGIAFGLGDGMVKLISVLTAIMILLIAFSIYKNYNKVNQKLLYGGIMILSGGIANLLDRIFRTYVVDFIYVKLIDFPVFNFADICIVVGVVALAIGWLFPNRGENIEKNNS